ncbi:MAG: ferredoxin [Dehalococcoidia bacterium]
MKIKVDPAKCQGHNRCYQTAPEMFQLDNYGYSTAKNDGKVPPELEEKVRLAVKNCPELAISIVEE